MSRFTSLTNQSKILVTTTGLVLVVLFGLLDYITGPEISFSVFYLLPISLVTWLTNFRGGIISAFISAVTWLTADLASGISYSHPFIPYWNAFVRLLVFLAIASLGSALRELNQDLEDRVKDRTALLEEEVAERKKVENRLQQYANRLEILHEIDHAILAAESLQAIAHATMRQIQNILQCDRASFLLLDFETQDVILFEPSPEEDNKPPVERRIPMDRFPNINAIIESLRQDIVEVNNDRANSPQNAPIAQILQTQKYLSFMFVPIVVQSELIGSFNLMSYQPNAFLAEHREIGRDIANQLGIAINQARMVEQLRADQENLQNLSQRLLDVQEAERRHIARELHDEIGQVLTSIGLTLEMAAQQRTEVLTERFKQAHGLVVELMERVSQLSLELRPALLDDLGLLPALLWHLDRYSSQTNIKVALKHSGLEQRRFRPEIETAAYRIVQEALTNVARHGGVNEAWVTIWYDQNILGIQVEDNGKGFDPDLVLKSRNSGGLLGVEERALLLNGKLTIETQIGSGTRLLAEIPARDDFSQKDN